MRRRDFLSWIGVGTLATSLPVVLAACNGGNNDTASDEPTDAATVNGLAEDQSTTANSDADNTAASGNSFVAVGQVSTLDEQGFLANPDLPGGPVIIIRDPEDASALIALDSRCPHRGCAVDWQPAESQFLCPCHQSAFSPSGSVVTGPATTPLEPRTAKVENGEVLVQTA